MSELSVELQELKTRLSKYMRQVKAGRTIVITEHGRAVGRIVPALQMGDRQIQAMIGGGLAEWNGQPLPPVRHRSRLRGKKTVADLLIADRE